MAGGGFQERGAAEFFGGDGRHLAADEAGPERGIEAGVVFEQAERLRGELILQG